jgi:hypothetical protein
MTVPAADVVRELALHYDAAALAERLRTEGRTEAADVVALMARQAGTIAAPRGKA